MKKTLFIILGVLLLSSTTFVSQAQNYVFDKKIALPGNGGYDYLSIDKVNNRLYVSHGTSVNVVDIATDKVIGTIDGMMGIHGIAIDNKANKGFVSDGK